MKLYTCASILMMAALLFASCSDTPADTVDTAAAADTTAAVETVTEARWKDAIPEGTDLGGKTVVINARGDEGSLLEIDTDEEIVKDAGMTIPEIFTKYGEEVFRKYEHDVMVRVGKLSGKVISTGGGVVTRENNYEPLHQNSKIFFIERDISSLPTDGRPLSKINSLESMYKKRLPMYKKFADVTVKNDSTPDACCDKIINS